MELFSTGKLETLWTRAVQYAAVYFPRSIDIA